MIDCNCFIGRTLAGRQMLAERDFNPLRDAGIRRIFVGSTQDDHTDGVESGRRLITTCSGTAFLSPVVTFTLDMGVVGREREYLDLDAAVYRLNAHPALSVSPGDRTLQRFLQGLAEKGGVLLTSLKTTPAAIAREVASARPDLPLVLTGVNYPEFGAALGILESHPRTYLEISAFSLFNGLEYLNRVLGAGRLVFGTNSPHFAFQANVLKLERARISGSEKRMIGGENFLALLDRRPGGTA